MRKITMIAVTILLISCGKKATPVEKEKSAEEQKLEQIKMSEFPCVITTIESHNCSCRGLYQVHATMFDGSTNVFSTNTLYAIGDTLDLVARGPKGLSESISIDAAKTTW